MLTLTLSRGSLLDSCRKEAEEKKSGCGHVGNLPGGAPRVIRCTLLKLRVYCLAPFAYEASTHRPTLHLVDHVTQGKSFASTTVLCALPFISWELPELSSSSWEAEGRELISLSLSHTLTFTHTHTYTNTHHTHTVHTLRVRGEKRQGEETERETLSCSPPALQLLTRSVQHFFSSFSLPLLFASSTAALFLSVSLLLVCFCASCSAVIALSKQMTTQIMHRHCVCCLSLEGRGKKIRGCT